MSKVIIHVAVFLISLLDDVTSNIVVIFIVVF